jgi:alpha-1,2-mannosyltransferase
LDSLALSFGRLTVPAITLERRQRAAARDLALHAILLALALWGAVAADLVSPGPLGRFSGLPKGNDFVQFYTMASLFSSGQFDALEDDATFRRAQRPYLGPTARASYPAVYGPQVAAALAPVAGVSYLAAFVCWTAITIAGIVWAVRRCWRACPSLRDWWPQVLAVTAAFPPFAYLVLAGQLSALAVVSLALVVWSLSRGSKMFAGLALGILGYKASLFVPALAVCALSGEGIMTLSAILSAAAQLLLVVPIVGVAVAGAFVGNVLAAIRNPDALAATPPVMFSIRTFWSQLLPADWATVAYGASALATWVGAAYGWRRTNDPLQRVALLATAVVISSPHLFLYDLVILIPAFIASAGILVARRARLLWWTTRIAFVTPLVAPPLAYLTHLQVAPLALTAWLVALLRE